VKHVCTSKEDVTLKEDFNSLDEDTKDVVHYCIRYVTELQNSRSTRSIRDHC